jgi:predicted alpha/beta-hydrolase family hydrolase
MTPRPPLSVEGKLSELRFPAGDGADVSALLLLPETARCLFVLAHGAGAGMRHPFMESVARRLAARGIGTFRYQFSYMERKAKAPDRQPILLATVRAAIEVAREAAPDLRLIAGGKSMGGRMTSLAAAAEPLPGVRGLVFLGFPLHAMGKPGIERADHLAQVGMPLLFLQGTRDSLADLDLLRPVIQRLGARATLHVVEDGDHSFHVRAGSGRNDSAALDELVERIDTWTETLP